MLVIFSFFFVVKSEPSFSVLHIFTSTLCFVFDWSPFEDTGLWNMGVLIKPAAQDPTKVYWSEPIEEYVGLSRIAP